MNYAKQLQSILKASGWSQEQLARELDVSFATLNSWVNERSRPREKALLAINNLYLTIVGWDTVGDLELAEAKFNAQNLPAYAKRIAENKEVLDRLTLYLTYHTNTIEGSTMTLADVSDVLFSHKVLAGRTAMEQMEAQTHQAALHWLLDELVIKGKDFVIDEDLILGIHLRLMNGIVSDAGRYRRHAVRIVGTQVAVANWVKIPELLGQFVASCNLPTTDLIRSMATSHAQFEKIHPFSDGNGRTGRLLLLAQALRAGIAPPIVIKERKYAYYKCLQMAQMRDDSVPLELFLAESIQVGAKIVVE